MPPEPPPNRDLRGRLKPWILPIWNGGHQVAWKLGEFADAIGRRRFARCDACGRFGPMLYRRWVVPPKLERMWGLSPREAEALARKESCDCWACGAKLRGRRLARALVDRFPAGDRPGRPKSAREWARTDAARLLQIAEVNRIDGLHEAIAGLPGLAYSDYLEGIEPGTVSGGVRCEDLTHLTYQSGRFDAVLSSETLEHVPDLAAALREIRRVLKPGGVHLFTVPVRPGLERSYPRRLYRADGTIEEIEPLCHPGGDVGYPVVTEFGRDLPAIVEAAGFSVSVRFGPLTEDDLCQVYEARKIGEDG
ncbi:MAG: methyltransferase domain-containing protein [Isosphaeraceae bacterium]